MVANSRPFYPPTALWEIALMEEDNVLLRSRLAETIDLLKALPLLSAASDKEPWCSLRIIDLNKVIEVAEGKTRKAEWVSVPCENVAKFGHSPHHWAEYRDGEEPLRLYHYCDGEEEKR